MSIKDSSSADEAFTLERHGDLTVITATRALETIEFGLEEQVAELILKPLRRQENPLIVFDLSQVDNFGSMFLALLIRCWKLALSQGGTMALSGVTERTRELLRVTALDTVWPIYEYQAGSDRSLAPGLIRRSRAVSPVLRRIGSLSADDPIGGFRVADLARDRRPSAQAVDRFAGESDDELTGKGQSTGSFSAVVHRVWISFRQSGADMGIYDREYYRGETGGSGWFSGVSPVCKTIIVINVAVFLLEQLHPTIDRHQYAIFAASPGWHPPPFSALATADGDVLPRRHLAPPREHVVLLDRRPRDGIAVRQPRFPGLLPERGDLQHPGVGLDRLDLRRTTDAAWSARPGPSWRVVMLYTLFYPKREILLFFIPMPMWLLLAIYLVFPLIARLQRRSDADRRRVASGRGRLWVSVQAVRPAVVAVVLGARVPAEAPHLLAGSPRADADAVAESVANAASVGGRRKSGSGLRICPKSSSTRGSTRFSPRSPAKAAPA